MVEIFKTMEDKTFIRMDKPEKDCWISMTNPTPQEISQISEKCQLEEDVLRAALDPEERARLEVEEEYTLIVIDIPVIEKEEVESKETEENTEKDDNQEKQNEEDCCCCSGSRYGSGPEHHRLRSQGWSG